MTETTARPTTSTAGELAFADRHIGPRGDATETMLRQLGYASLDDLVDTAVPADIRQAKPLDLPAARSEAEVLDDLRAIAAKNIVKTQMIGQGFYNTITPPVILRNVLEDPAWYTAYTPYQPEISQGRLEALLNFQTMVSDLTGLPIANASLLDEASAVAEAVLLMRRANKAKAEAKTVLDADMFPQTIAVVKGRAEALGFELEIADLSQGLPDGEISGIVLQQPGNSGRVSDHAGVIAAAKERGAMVTVAADILALTLIVPPGEQGADIAVGNTQRLGVPLFFGGPHAAYMSVRDGLVRSLPGRLVGVSKDDTGLPAYRLALQTREQHIRREKATSNICTAQALLAITSSMYGVYHGPEGLKAIAQRAHLRAGALASVLRDAGFTVANESFFDTLTLQVPGRADELVAAAEDNGINLRRLDADTV
ncbi:MAG: glycine dehydrogenase (aminomethyl-transferring), partial [Micrococcaceae bacterium]|nr:glycine dehydrogenase (aminomethyl-transferring) [Micrococcaceae bacterium]